MSDQFLLIDDARREYVDCDKFLPNWRAYSDGFAVFFRAQNWALNDDEPPPEKSDRYVLCETDARKLFDWMEAGGPFRLLSANECATDDFEIVEATYKRISLYPENT